MPGAALGQVQSRCQVYGEGSATADSVAICDHYLGHSQLDSAFVPVTLALG